MQEFLNWLAPIWQPHPGQLAFLEAKAKTKVLACGRRWGKTDACAVQILSKNPWNLDAPVRLRIRRQSRRH